MYRKILCATDFSEGSRSALRAAAERATREGAELALVYVHEPLAITLPPEVVIDSRLLPSVRAHEQVLLDEWQAEASRLADRRATAHLVEGTPWERIVQVAREGGHDLVVVATSGRTGLARAVIGSTAEKVVRHAGCDVLVVRS
jgi:nucleotide-binding universal stress UspA family protein